MKAFEWVSPGSFGEVIAALRPEAGADIDEAPRPIAGGQDLLTTMKDYITRPTRVVNLKTVRGLDQIDELGAGQVFHDFEFSSFFKFASAWEKLAFTAPTEVPTIRAISSCGRS